MKILILGGKKFIGYHIALEAEKRGHMVTFFNRGKLIPNCYLTLTLFREIETRILRD